MPADLARRAASTVARMAAGRRLLLLLDFDGTLCEFDPDPAAVWLAAARRDLLLGLQRSRAITLGIVSGRRLDDVRRRTRLAPGAYYAGLHGLEIEGDGVHFVHPDVATTRTVVERLVVRLETEFADLKGVFVENKGLSVAAHYRDAQPEVGAQVPPAVERVARDELASGRLRVMRGACMVEL
ncbi:MAG TPA: trehalose-phosphatase, partial [Vicinamibacterales bacterium]|nr:trehalose-phosphatase [Vicinamibacterales bacterium]